MLAYQLLCHIYKKLYRQDYREYIIGLDIRYDCNQFKYGIYVNLNMYLCNYLKLYVCTYLNVSFHNYVNISTSLYPPR